MEQVNPVENVRHKKNRSRIIKSALRIDMTPMVDLGFLLICFFVYTTSMSESKVTDLYMPKDGPPILIRNNATLTILIGAGDKIVCYEGQWNEARANNAILKTSYSIHNGLGNIIRSKQAMMNKWRGAANGRNDLMLIIKATRDASYKQLMAVLDEVLINDVKRYAVVDPTEEEADYLEK